MERYEGITMLTLTKPLTTLQQIELIQKICESGTPCENCILRGAICEMISQKQETESA
jgi:hypothetical protein